MPRIRTLKPEFFRSPSTAKADFPVRIFYQALWCWADDFGIGETNINGLLGFAFPDEDEFTAQDVRRFCADVAQHYEVTFYTNRGRHYYAVPTWDQHQKTERREERRKHPTPDDPDSVPDQRFQPRANNAPEVSRNNGADSRETSAGTGEQGNRGTGEQEPPYPPSDEPAPRTPAHTQTKNGAALARRDFANLPARSEPAYRIAEAFSASLAVPVEAGLLSGIGVQIDKCLKRGIPPPAIAAGLRAWTDSDSWAPSQIPNFVHKVNNRGSGNGIGKPTLKAAEYGTAAEELLAELGTTT